MIEDFILLKRIEARLDTAGQWLVKTPNGDAAYKELGRWSRWRRNPNRWVAGYEVLETHIELLELAKRVGCFDVSKERYMS